MHARDMVAQAQLQSRSASWTGCRFTESKACCICISTSHLSNEHISLSSPLAQGTQQFSRLYALHLVNLAPPMRMHTCTPGFVAALKLLYGSFAMCPFKLRIMLVFVHTHTYAMPDLTYACKWSLHPVLLYLPVFWVTIADLHPLPTPALTLC